MQREAQLGFVAAMTLLAVPALLWTGAVRSDGVGALSASTAKVWNEAVAAAESGNALRAFQLEVELMSALMQLKPGVTFADIGAFDGRYAMRLVQKVLPGGSAAYVAGHAFFAVQGTLLSRRTASPTAAWAR